MNITNFDYFTLAMDYTSTFKLYDELLHTFKTLKEVKKYSKNIESYMVSAKQMTKNCCSLKYHFLWYKHLSVMIDNIDLLKNDTEISYSSLEILNMFNRLLRKNMLHVTFHRSMCEIPLFLYVKIELFEMNSTHTKEFVLFNKQFKDQCIAHSCYKKNLELLNQVIKKIRSFPKAKNINHYLNKLRIMKLKMKIGRNKIFKKMLDSKTDFLLSYKLKIIKNLIQDDFDIISKP
ncbi:hypothetical protein CDIK_1794 [Cucumispora dikerogammari]|nr:hypothetical protein CDIK_1794 [Cucumispora dikerogammari]